MTEPIIDVLDTPEAGRRVVVGGALRVAGFIVGVAASVVGAALVTRHLGPEDYGRYQTVVALVTIVQAVTDLGMTSLGLREYSQRVGEDRDRFMRVLLGMRIAMTGVGVGLAVAVALLLGYDSEMVLGAALMGVGVMVLVIGGTLGIPLAAELRMGVVTGIDLARQLLTTIGLVLMVLTGAGVVALLGVTIPVGFIVLGGTLWFVRGAISLRPSFEPRAWMALIRPAASFALATTAGMIYLYTALILCQLFASEYETGLFAAAFRVFAIVAAVPAVLVTTAFPLLSRAARDDHARLAYASQRLFDGTALLGGAAVVGCVLGAEPVIEIVAGDQYAGSIPVLRLLGVALGITCVLATWGFTLLALHRHRAMVLANLAALTVSAVTVSLLAASHGALGAVWGTLLGEVTLATGYVVGLSRVSGMRPRFVRVARILPAVAVSLICWWLPIPAVATTVVGLLVFGVAVLAFGAVPTELRQHLPARLASFGLAGPDDRHSNTGSDAEGGG